MLWGVFMKNKNNAFEIYDDNIITPFSENWHNTIKVIENLLEGDKNKNTILQEIYDVVIALVKDGHTHEDLVLETAEWYILLKNANLKLSHLKSSLDINVYNGVNILLNNSIHEICKNTEYLYLDKIKLAEFIVLLQNYHITPDLLNDIDFLITNYPKIYKNLMSKLIILRKNMGR